MPLTVLSAVSSIAAFVMSPLYTIHDHVKSGEMRGIYSRRDGLGLSEGYRLPRDEKKAVQSRD
ncbi:hypothetical protein [Pararhizobium sp. PWRC1-1]|uniref:hypothetical protein n=1 Tax=Pararhizobium sp. PWRC1-1 TaxID=2804566 RepID=UPI003CE944A4